MSTYLLNTTLAERKPEADSDWVETPYPNLIRYKPSGNYFGRVRVNGKLIRRSLATHVLSVAKLKVSDFLQDNRRLAINKGEPVKGEVIIEIYTCSQPGALKRAWIFPPSRAG
jgi:hypothetical protein